MNDLARMGMARLLQGAAANILLALGLVGRPLDLDELGVVTGCPQEQVREGVHVLVVLKLAEPAPGCGWALAAEGRRFLKRSAAARRAAAKQACPEGEQEHSPAGGQAPQAGQALPPGMAQPAGNGRARSAAAAEGQPLDEPPGRRVGECLGVAGQALLPVAGREPEFVPAGAPASGEAEAGALFPSDLNRFPAFVTEEEDLEEEEEEIINSSTSLSSSFPERHEFPEDPGRAAKSPSPAPGERRKPRAGRRAAAQPLAAFPDWAPPIIEGLELLFGERLFLPRGWVPDRRQLLATIADVYMRRTALKKPTRCVYTQLREGQPPPQRYLDNPYAFLPPAFLLIAGLDGEAGSGRALAGQEAPPGSPPAPGDLPPSPRPFPPGAATGETPDAAPGAPPGQAGGAEQSAASAAPPWPTSTARPQRKKSARKPHRRRPPAPGAPCSPPHQEEHADPEPPSSLDLLANLGGERSRALSARQAWQLAHDFFRPSMSPILYDAFLRNACLVHFEPDACVFTLAVDHPNDRDWLRDRTTAALGNTLCGVCNRPASVRYVTWDEWDPDSALDPPS